MKKLAAALSLLLTIGLVFALSKKWGDLPPIAPLLDPFAGFWANAEPTDRAFSDDELSLDGLQAPVTVRFDSLRVPHVFAQNDHDLYFAQGYLTARDRLWQMEFQTHAAAGRLSEIVGEKAFELDRYKRRLGMVYGAEQALKSMLSDPVTKTVVEAYSDGVNAYISGLSLKNFPLEYKLLGYAPEPWTPLKCALLLKEMTLTLAGRSNDRRLTNVRQKIGPEATADLFPDFPGLIVSPIIPTGTAWDFKPVPVSDAPDERASTTLGVTRNVDDFDDVKTEGIGSNNWAVHGSRTATGLPILAGDPHLSLTLPSIWYQMQLVAPGVNAAGVTIPGSPLILIGFNHDIAWSETNVGADVMDWYSVKFKDKTRQDYEFEGQWKPVKTRLEVIKVRGKPDVVDTVRYTHHGPIMYQEVEKPFNEAVPPAHALRWVAHESSNDVRCFYELNRAKNYDEYVRALSHYVAAAQNFVFASNENDVAIWVNGKFPLRRRDQGKFILDGSRAANDWLGWIPHAHNPHVRNPPRGFVSSANQNYTDPTYPYYLTGESLPAERGLRINERLAAMTKATPDSLRNVQNDNFNTQARTLLPVLLPLLPPRELSAGQLEALNHLKTWNFQNNPDRVEPTLFIEWTAALYDAIWRDELGSPTGEPTIFPTSDRTMRMVLNEPSAKWFDDISTPDRRETLADLTLRSFKATTDTLRRQLGPLGPKWALGTQRGTDVRHLARLAPLSRLGLVTGGGVGIVNATNKAHGPSWRMVVALGKDGPTAYGTYPGGQSGSPGSRFYDNQLETWRQGQLYPLVYLKTADEKQPGVVGTVILKKK
ncbi:MAG: penicillin acylase family protein [Sphingobacteriaceae bacterium]|nr:penicillin acylase family protein [Cytophagaceae bacterium]